MSGSTWGRTTTCPSRSRPRSWWPGCGPVLRQARGPLAATVTNAPRVHVDGDLEVDIAARQARMGGDVVSLTAREFELLAFLVRHPRRAFRRGAARGRLGLSLRRRLHGHRPRSPPAGEDRAGPGQPGAHRHRVGCGLPLGGVWRRELGYGRRPGAGRHAGRDGGLAGGDRRGRVIGHAGARRHPARCHQLWSVDRRLRRGRLALRHFRSPLVVRYPGGRGGVWIVGRRPGDVRVEPRPLGPGGRRRGCRHRWGVGRVGVGDRAGPGGAGSSWRPPSGSGRWSPAGAS